MTNVQPNTPFRACVPEGYEARGPHLYLVPLMAYGAALRYGGKRLTTAQWRMMLRRMRFAHTGTLPDALCRSYPNPLSLDEWADLFEQLAVEGALASKYPHLR